MTGYTELLIGLGIAITIFFVFRGVNLWYWRINDLIKIQEKHETLLTEQNNMLKNIYVQLGGKIEDVSRLPKNIEISKINDNDIEQVESLKKTLKKDELIVKIKQNGRIEKWEKTDWDEIIKIGNQDKFELIFSNGN
ncbi:MAG: hypothetical protein MI739_12480 [Bacteroidales bacterium]|nr:hypothetical protein [Bacteroidales bacterium]